MKAIREYNEDEASFERILFFTDAVVAIAITLLALDLRLPSSKSTPFTFQELLVPWQRYLAFGLSFINIAGFWKTHHTIFTFARKMNDKMLVLNTCWLFFIVILPFSTTVLSSHFDTTPAVFLYSFNIFMLSVLQNFIWGYADTHDGFIKEAAGSKEIRRNLRPMFNIDMLNGLIAVVMSFINPVAAFILLFFKIPTFIFVMFYITARRRRRLRKIGLKGSLRRKEVPTEGTDDH